MTPFIIHDNGTNRVVIDPDDIGLVISAVDQILMSGDRLKTTYGLRKWDGDRHTGCIDWIAEDKKAVFSRSNHLAAGATPEAIQAITAIEVPAEALPGLLDAMQQHSNGSN